MASWANLVHHSLPSKDPSLERGLTAGGGRSERQRANSRRRLSVGRDGRSPPSRPSGSTITTSEDKYARTRARVNSSTRVLELFTCFASEQAQVRKIK